MSGDDRIRVLAVDDDAATRASLDFLIRAAGWAPTTVSCGEAAVQVMTGPNPPHVALVDWLLPDLQGPEICRRLREAKLAVEPYLILVTVKASPRDIVAGLDAGADDYIVKPLDGLELQARVRVGLRTLTLQQHLASRVQELEEAAAQIKQLEGLLPICAYCRRIRDDSDYWQSLEEYLRRHRGVMFTHGCCPDCFEKHIEPYFEREARDASSHL